MPQTITQNQGKNKAFESKDVELKNVFKFFNKEPVICGINLDIKQGEFFSILGPSGCGKTTTLRLVAGFERADTGNILIQGRSVNRVPAYRRPVNTVFQSYALFSHLNVWDNVAFGLRLQRISKAEIKTRVLEVLELVKMEGLRSRYPSQLSGGQQQRVALARALVNRPKVLLLDEPLGALDLKLRKQMQFELSNLHRELGLTFVMVTHDREEALSLSDRIAIMNQGKIEQVGTPTQIYERPQTTFVADFIGDTNLFEGEIVGASKEEIAILTKAGIKIIVRRREDTNLVISKSVSVSVRPEKIQLSLYNPSLQNNCFEGRVVSTMYMGTHINYVVELNQCLRVNVKQPNTEGSLPNSDMPIYAWWSETDCLALQN